MASLLEFITDSAPEARALADALRRVERVFESALDSDLACVRDLCAHVERYRGKMLRPTLALLSGMAAAGRADAVTQKHIVIGAVIELVHMATLVHDDVLDDADVRRRGATVNTLHGNETAIILGDFLISSAFHLCSSLDDQRVALRIGEVTTRVCEGEMLQIRNRGNADLSEDTYFQIIERKTAALIGAACELGAAASGDDTAAGRLWEFGVKIGCAYQIQDDLLDLLGEERVVGKSVGRDVEKGKLTLPLIRHLAGATGPRRHAAMRAMGLDGGPGDLAGARAMALASGGAAEASAAAVALAEEAKALLDPLPASPAREMLRRMADAAVERRF